MQTLRAGAVGRDVGEMQQALIEAGYPIDPADLSAMQFGRSTVEALRHFQAQRVGPSGHALVEDGICGPSTWWALEHQDGRNEQAGHRYIAPGWRCHPSEAREAVRAVLIAAIADIGRREDPKLGPNRGAEIEKFNGSNGEPWCADAVSLWYRKAPMGSPFGKLSSCYKILEWARPRGLILPPHAKILPGDLGLIMRTEFKGHVTLIGADLLDGHLATIEGNASNACRGLVRAQIDYTHFVRPIPL